MIRIIVQEMVRVAYMDIFMNKQLKETIDTIDHALYSYHVEQLSLTDLKYFREIIERWLRRVEDTIKSMEVNK